MFTFTGEPPETMGEADRYIEKRYTKMSMGDDNNSIITLIGINVLFFIAIGIIRLFYLMNNSTDSAFQYEVFKYFELPGQLESLAVKPWTLITYMFMHPGVLSILISMVWLWVFGRILQQVAHNRLIIPLYLYGGFTGAVFFIATNYALPNLRSEIVYSGLVGSHPAVMALAVGATAFAPRFKLFRMIQGGIPLWILTALYVLIDLTGTQNTAVSLAHLGGGAMGYLFVVSYQKGRDWSAWMNQLYLWFNQLTAPKRAVPEQTKIREKVFYNTGHRQAYFKTPVITQQRIDEILDKINQSGYETLSEEEKSILKKASESEDF